jgi:hypothetical protein
MPLAMKSTRMRKMQTPAAIPRATGDGAPDCTVALESALLLERFAAFNFSTRALQQSSEAEGHSLMAISVVLKPV